LAFPILAEEPAFLVIDATAIPRSQRQPTWIALAPKEGELVHVPTGKAVVELSPGSYRIAHIDFGADIAGSRGTMYLGSDRLDLRAGTISYFGLLQLEIRDFAGLGTRYGHQRVRLIQSEELAQRAHQLSPDAFRKYPFRMLNGKPARPNDSAGQ
jgi:hypothetical protein